MKKIINKTITTSLIAILFISTGVSQSSSIKRANELYDLLKYNDAIKFYEKANNKSETKESLVGLANSYYKTNDVLNASEYYGKAFKKDYLNEEETVNYVKSLHSIKKYNELDSVLNLKQVKSIKSKEIDIIKESINKTEEMVKDSVFFSVSPYLISNDYSYFSPTLFENDLLVASDNSKSSGSKNETWKGGYYFDIFDVNGDNIKPLSSKINSPLHEASPSYCAEEKKLYFTRSNLKKGNKAQKNSENENHLKIYSSIYLDGDWIEPTVFPFSNDDYSTGHPAITKNGNKLFFISEKPGGYGETDIYVSELVDNNWSEPTNLGELINTPGKEMFPTVLEKNDTLYLYYSSNYDMGLGGLDIYVAKNYNGKWFKPMHLTYPLNSEGDDFGLIWESDTSGYLSSNRNSENNNDGIYKFNLIPQRYFVAGYVKDGNKKTTLPYSTVTLVDDFSESKSNLTTDENGYFITELSKNSNYKLTASKDAYPAKSIGVTTVGLTRSDTIYVNIELTNFPEFYVTGTVTDKATKKAITEGNILLEGDNNTTNKLAISNGVFFAKIDSNTLYALTTKVPNYFLKKAETTTKGLKKSDTLVVNFELEKLEINKAIKLDNIYYDLGKYAIREDAKKSLNDLVETMKDNPTIKIELSSHTDSRGSSSSNQRLSQKRAQSAINYLVKQGIDKNRLTAVGYGEEKLLNKCSNGVKCTEEEHQFNRRTEFKVTSN